MVEAMNFTPLLAAGPAVHIHLAATLAALTLGIVMLVRRKGTTWHKRLGWVWVSLMLAAAVSSLWITGLNGQRYSPIHALSILVLVTVPAAVYAIRRGRLQTHRRAMLTIYFTGLVLPGLFTLLPARLLGGLVFGH